MEDDEEENDTKTPMNEVEMRMLPVIQRQRTEDARRLTTTWFSIDSIHSIIGDIYLNNLQFVVQK
jgi:hypothetical protein